MTGPVFSIAGDWVAGNKFIAPLGRPDEQVAYGCPDVFSRGDQVVVADWCLGRTCGSSTPSLARSCPYPTSLAERTPSAIGSPSSGHTSDCHHRRGREPQLVPASDGVDVVGEDYPGVAALSTNGASFIFGDHSESPSPDFTNTVTARDTADGSVFGTWSVPGVVRDIQSDGTWLLITEIGEEDAINGLDNIAATTAVFLPSGKHNPDRIFARDSPAPAQNRWFRGTRTRVGARAGTTREAK